MNGFKAIVSRQYSACFLQGSHDKRGARLLLSTSFNRVSRIRQALNKIVVFVIGLTSRQSILQNN